jgi:sugar phosphate isomerase/epimerase
MDRLKEEVEACAILGAKVLTFPVVDGQPIDPERPGAETGVRFEQMLPALVAQYQELADHAAGSGVELAVLNHCFLVYLGWHQKWMVRLTERKNAGACVDPGNYLHYGHEDPVGVCRELAAVTKMVRAGDVAPVPEDEVVAGFKENGSFGPWRGVTFGQGVIDQEACYRHLAEGGYEGVVSLKTGGSSPEGPLAAIKESWRKLCELLERVG